MYFRLECKLDGLLLSENELIETVINCGHAVTVKIQGPNKNIQNQSNTTCVAFVERDVPEKNRQIFESILQDKNFNPAAMRSQTYNSHQGVATVSPPVKTFPQSFTSFMCQVHKELTDSTNKVLDAFFWRTATKNNHKIESDFIRWSKNNKNWHLSPLHESVMVIDMQHQFSLLDSQKKEISRLAETETQAPVHHELFREAWGQRNDNPRSSLVIGISSLEVAIQLTFRELSSDESWPFENIESPPVVDILTKHLTQLPVKNKIDNKVLPPPQAIIKTIKKGVFSRNNIVHNGKSAPNSVSLNGMLNAIRDVLWLLDYYRGHKWAYDFIAVKP